jgi:hypothetical protein
MEENRSLVAHLVRDEGSQVQILPLRPSKINNLEPSSGLPIYRGGRFGSPVPVDKPAPKPRCVPRNELSPDGPPWAQADSLRGARLGTDPTKSRNKLPEIGHVSISRTSKRGTNTRDAASSAPPSAAGIASRSTGADPPDRPGPAARPGSWPRPFAKKISLDCQLADLLVKLGNLRLIHGAWARHPALAAGE